MCVGMEFRAVFVSTVRSRHHRCQLTDSVGEFGFLSEAQLVNTALTRAKSWLAVVGDPVALCSIGNCGAIWRSYLKHCQRVGGMHPTDLSLEDILQQSLSLMQLFTVSSLITDTVNSVNADTVNSVSADTVSSLCSFTAELSQSHTRAQVSPYLTSETSCEAVAASQQPCVVSQASSSQQQSTINMLQQIYGGTLDDARNTDTVRDTEGTATQAAFIEGAKARDRHVISEDSSSDDGDIDDVRQRVKSLEGFTSAPQVTNIEDDDDDDDTDDDTDDDSDAEESVISLSELSLDYQIEADDIITQIAQVCCFLFKYFHYIRLLNLSQNATKHIILC